MTAVRRPQVVAHRGASDAEPEHTLAAYLQAIECGADALECDVRLTADGHLVCVHDRRVNRTSDGTGLVSTLELADLEGLDWGSWKLLSAAGGDRDGDVPDVVDPTERSHLLTLRRLFGVVADSARPVRLAVETKHPNRYGGQVERALVELLREFGWDSPADLRTAPVRMMSFSQLAVRRMHQFAPLVPLVLLTEHRIPLPVVETSLPAGTAVGPWIELLREHPRYVEKLRARGREVHVWTVDTPDDVQLCLDSGVDVVITNRPAQVLEQLTGRLRPEAGPGR